MSHAGAVGKTEFEKITVKKICERAQVSRSTFYAHFKAYLWEMKEPLCRFQTDRLQLPKLVQDDMIRETDKDVEEENENDRFTACQGSI
ncbi:MAG TPA: TetR family transcriptional regulator [Candidatus Choladousia intestinipullorum]|nr:TetR family transcriptional regulator [Candidatus Choladousia intestinipullorum]